MCDIAESDRSRIYNIFVGQEYSDVFWQTFKDMSKEERLESVGSILFMCPGLKT